MYIDADLLVVDRGQPLVEPRPCDSGPVCGSVVVAMPFLAYWTVSVPVMLPCTLQKKV